VVATFLRLRLDETALHSDIKEREEPRKKEDRKHTKPGQKPGEKSKTKTVDKQAMRAETKSAKRDMEEADADVNPDQRKRFVRA